MTRSDSQAPFANPPERGDPRAVDHRINTHDCGGDSAVPGYGARADRTVARRGARARRLPEARRPPAGGAARRRPASRDRSASAGMPGPGGAPDSALDNPQRETAPPEAGPFRSFRLRAVSYGVAILQRPRPCVAAMMYEPSGLSCRSFTDTFGSVPRRDQVVAAPWPALATKTPMSLASTSLPDAVRTRSSPGASGRLPLMSVHVAPPSVVSKTWPSPAENVFVHRREKPLKTTYACAGFAGSTVIAWMKRFGNDAGRVSACQEPP